MDMLVFLLADVLLLPVVIIAAVAILRLPGERRWQAITRGIVTALTALWFAKLAAQFYQGVRPFVTLGVEPGASFLPNPGFPSDHALLAFTASFVVLGAVRNWKLAAAMFSLGALVAFGRVLALVHTPADVIGGFFCALVAAVVWYGPKFRQKYYTNR